MKSNEPNFSSQLSTGFIEDTGLCLWSRELGDFLETATASQSKLNRSLEGGSPSTGGIEGSPNSIGSKEEVLESRIREAEDIRDRLTKVFNSHKNLEEEADSLKRFEEFLLQKEQDFINQEKELRRLKDDKKSWDLERNYLIRECDKYAATVKSLQTEKTRLQTQADDAQKNMFVLDKQSKNFQKLHKKFTSLENKLDSLHNHKTNHKKTQLDQEMQNVLDAKNEAMNLIKDVRKIEQNIQNDILAMNTLKRKNAHLEEAHIALVAREQELQQELASQKAVIHDLKRKELKFDVDTQTQIDSNIASLQEKYSTCLRKLNETKTKLRTVSSKYIETQESTIRLQEYLSKLRKTNLVMNKKQEEQMLKELKLKNVAQTVKNQIIDERELFKKIFSRLAVTQKELKQRLDKSGLKKAKKKESPTMEVSLEEVGVLQKRIQSLESRSKKLLALDESSEEAVSAILDALTKMKEVLSKSKPVQDGILKNTMLALNDIEAQLSHLINIASTSAPVLEEGGGDEVGKVEEMGSQLSRTSGISQYGVNEALQQYENCLQTRNRLLGSRHSASQPFIKNTLEFHKANLDFALGSEAP